MQVGSASLKKQIFKKRWQLAKSKISAESAEVRVANIEEAISKIRDESGLEVKSLSKTICNTQLYSPAFALTIRLRSRTLMRS